MWDINMPGEDLKPRIDQLGYDFADDIRDKILPKIDDIRLNMEGDIRNILDKFVLYLKENKKSIGKIIDEFNNCIGGSVGITGYLKNNNRYKNLFTYRYNGKLDNLNKLKIIFKNLYNKIIKYYNKASENNTNEEIKNNLKGLKNNVIELKNNVIDLLMILEENNFTKKLLENFKRRDEIEPIPGIIGLLVLYFTGPLGRNLEKEKEPDNTEGKGKEKESDTHE